MAVTETCMTGCTLASDYINWVPIVGIVILSVLLLLAIIYMLSRLFSKKEWEALAKTELTQTFAAVIWVVIIAAFATFACSVACSLTKDTNPFTTSLDYLNNIHSILEGRINELLEIAKDIRIKTAKMYWLPGVAIKPWDGCSVIANNLESFTAILAPFIGSILVQQYALSLVQNLAFTVILPIGIILRIIPFAREMGASLIALAVALYIVLPLTYVFADNAMSTVTISTKAIESPGQDCVNKDKAREMFEAIGYTFPQAVFFPALSMIITIACARSLSKVFMYDFQDITQ